MAANTRNHGDIVLRVTRNLRCECTAITPQEKGIFAILLTGLLMILPKAYVTTADHGNRGCIVCFATPGFGPASAFTVTTVYCTIRVERGIYIIIIISLYIMHGTFTFGVLCLLLLPFPLRGHFRTANTLPV